MQSQNSVAVGGLVGGAAPASGDQAYTYPIVVENNGNLTSLEDFNNLIVNRSPSGNLLKLKDVGEVRYGTNSFAVQGIDKNGHEALTLAVYQTPASNALDVSDAVVTAQLDQFRSLVPPGVTVNQIYDIGQFIEASVDGVIDALGLAIVLVLVILFLFLQNWRATVVPSLAIPISLIGSFAFLKVFGFSINQLTLLGLVLATGLVVDDAIVVIEAVSTNIEQGMKPREAALACMGELFGALLATALVLMAVFVPVAFYPGGIGIIYKQFALTIAFSIAISAFNALSFSPMLSGLILPREKPAEPSGSRLDRGGRDRGSGLRALQRRGLRQLDLLWPASGIGALAGANLPRIFTAVQRRALTACNGPTAALLTRVIALRQLILGGLARGHRAHRLRLHRPAHRLHSR